MKKYQIEVKEISSNTFEITASSKETAVSQIEKMLKESNKSTDSNYIFKVNEIEENINNNDCESCEFYCHECGCCLYNGEYDYE